MMMLFGASSSALLGAARSARSVVSRAGTISANFGAPVVMGTEEMMSDKKTGHGTSTMPCQKNLRWDCDVETADRICNYNRHYAEYGGFWERETTFLSEESEASGEITFYDSNTGKPLFFGPKGRDWNSFVKESKVHGWPSFRDSEVVWENTRGSHGQKYRHPPAPGARPLQRPARLPTLAHRERSPL